MRVARAAREMAIVPLGIYSEADANAYHLQFVDEARCVGPAAAAQSYLNAEAIIAAALAMRADAVHPGYGFLSERAPFAAAVRDAGLIFVGPAPEAMAAMGSKIEAKRRVRASGVPTVPGYDGDDQSLATLRREAQRVGFPLLIKASAGGGGRGMRVVDSVERFDEALEAAKREALAAFGDDAVLLERYLRDPRHIEFQILADAHGTTLHFGERECSIQRRHQKIIEEAPSVALTPSLRAEMGAAAVRAAESVGYVNAGTAEFMLDSDGAVLLSRNECASAGRASGDRVGLRHRPGAMAAAHCLRRTARRSRRTRSGRAAGRSKPGSTPKIPRTTCSRRPGRSRTGRRRRGPAFASMPALPRAAR